MNPIEMNFSEKDLYFGSLKNIVYLRQVSGQCYTYKSGDIFFHADRQSAQEGLQYRLPQEHLGKEYSKTIVPCIPANDLYTRFFEFQLPESKIEKRQNKNELLTLSDTLNSCFIKVDANSPYDAIAFQSGKRSAILKTKESIYVRLKGCGNLNQGFPLEKSMSKYAEAYEPRGCQFNHTAKRELYVSDKVDRFLKENNSESGIKPLGYWLYDTDFEIQNDQMINENEQPLKNDVKAIRKYCTLYETIGEKRLTTHLLQGLSILLRGCLRQVSKEQTPYRYIQQLFPAERCLPDDKDPENGVYQAEENLMELLEVEQRTTELLQKETFSVEKEQLYINLFEKLPLDSHQYDQSQIDYSKLFESLKSNSIYQSLYSDVSSRLSSLHFNQLYSNIALIYARIGWELGCTMRSFYQHKLNWGYYADHDNAFHCNAHPNNIIVLPQGFDNLTAPLDFDMAFFEEEYININNDEETYGKNDTKLFNTYMELGRQSMEIALTGMEIMSNFSFETQIFANEEIEADRLHSLFIQSLRDTMRVYYMRGFENRISPVSLMQMSQPSFNSLHDIIILSLIFTSDEMC